MSTVENSKTVNEMRETGYSEHHSCIRYTDINDEDPPLMQYIVPRKQNMPKNR